MTTNIMYVFLGITTVLPMWVISEWIVKSVSILFSVLKHLQLLQREFVTCVPVNESKMIQVSLPSKAFVTVETLISIHWRFYGSVLLVFKSARIRTHLQIFNVIFRLTWISNLFGLCYKIFLYEFAKLPVRYIHGIWYYIVEVCM